jgi:hypothetical protein
MAHRSFLVGPPCKSGRGEIIVPLDLQETALQTFRNLALAIGASLLVGIAVPATAQTKPARIEAAGAPIRSVLWVGNSFFYYNNSMHGHYNDLAKAADPAAATAASR